jgi:DNA end-binding protein Ku
MRALWSGMISFGLINIPVKLYPAAKERELELNYLRKKDLCPIRYARVCRTTGEEVPYRDIVRGFEYRKGDYVVLEDDDLKRANALKTGTLQVVEFVDEREIDIKLLEKPFYLEPGQDAAKVYALLREALLRANRVAVVRFVLKTREHMGILKADEKVIVLNQMRFQEDLCPVSGLVLPENERITADELSMTLRLINSLSVPFHAENYRDTYTRELKQVIEEKARGKLPREVPEEKIQPTKVPDLLARLKESLEYAHAGKK